MDRGYTFSLLDIFFVEHNWNNLTTHCIIQLFSKQQSRNSSRLLNSGSILISFHILYFDSFHRHLTKLFHYSNIVFRWTNFVRWIWNWKEKTEANIFVHTNLIKLNSTLDEVPLACVHLGNYTKYILIYKLHRCRCRFTPSKEL